MSWSPFHGCQHWSSYNGCQNSLQAEFWSPYNKKACCHSCTTVADYPAWFNGFTSKSNQSDIKAFLTWYQKFNKIHRLLLVVACFQAHLGYVMPQIVSYANGMLQNLHCVKPVTRKQILFITSIFVTMYRTSGNLLNFGMQTHATHNDPIYLQKTSYLANFSMLNMPA